MMDNIISRETIRERARAAFNRGAGRDDHGMNWFAPAVVDWQAEWDRCAQAAQHVHTLVKFCLGEVSPP
jgi:hypothetical protein